MGATEEQMALLSGAHVTHVAYILLLFSVAFLLFLFVAMLLHIYASYTWPISGDNNNNHSLLPKLNGSAGGGRNGHVRGAGSMGDAQRLRDAEEFELEGLMSEDEDLDEDGRPPGRRKQSSSSD